MFLLLWKRRKASEKGERGKISAGIVCWGLCNSLTFPPGPQYGSLERAWGAIMTEADKVSELHQEVKNSLLNEDLEKVKNWQKDAYHKQIMGGFKETKEAEDGFRKAQKPWAKKMKEVPQAGRAGCSSRVASHGVGVGEAAHKGAPASILQKELSEYAAFPSTQPAASAGPRAWRVCSTMRGSTPR